MSSSDERTPSAPSVETDREEGRPVDYDRWSEPAAIGEGSTSPALSVRATSARGFSAGERIIGGNSWEAGSWQDPNDDPDFIERQQDSSDSGSYTEERVTVQLNDFDPSNHRLPPYSPPRSSSLPPTRPRVDQPRTAASHFPGPQQRRQTTEQFEGLSERMASNMKQLVEQQMKQQEMAFQDQLRRNKEQITTLMKHMLEQMTTAAAAGSGSATATETDRLQSAAEATGRQTADQSSSNYRPPPGRADQSSSNYRPPPGRAPSSSAGGTQTEKLARCISKLDGIQAQLLKSTQGKAVLRHLLTQSRDERSRMENIMSRDDDIEDEMWTEAQNTLVQVEAAELVAVQRIEELEVAEKTKQASASAMPKLSFGKWSKDKHGSYALTWWAARKSLLNILSLYADAEKETQLWSQVWAVIPAEKKQELSHFEFTSPATTGLKQLIAFVDLSCGNAEVIVPRLEEEIRQVRYARDDTELPRVCEDYLSLLTQLANISTARDPTWPASHPDPPPFSLSRDLSLVIARGTRMKHLEPGTMRKYLATPEPELYDVVRKYLKNRYDDSQLVLQLLGPKKKVDKSSGAHVSSKAAATGGSAPNAGIVDNSTNNSGIGSGRGGAGGGGNGGQRGDGQTPKKRTVCNFCLNHLKKPLDVSSGHLPHRCTNIAKDVDAQILTKARVCWRCLSNWEEAAKKEHDHKCAVKNRKGEPFDPSCKQCLRHRSLCTDPAHKTPPKSMKQHLVAAALPSCATAQSPQDTHLARLQAEPLDIARLPVGTGSQRCVYGRVRVAFDVDGVTQYDFIPVLYDSGSQDSWFSPSLLQYQQKRETTPFECKSMHGDYLNTQGERIYLKAVTNSGKWVVASGLLNPSVDTSDTCRVKLQWTSIPSDLASKHGLTGNPNDLGNIDNNQVIAQPELQVKAILGQDWSTYFPMEVARYLDEHGGVTLYQNLFAPEILISGGRMSLSPAQVDEMNATLPPDQQHLPLPQKSALATTKTFHVSSSPTIFNTRSPPAHEIPPPADGMPATEGAVKRWLSMTDEEPILRRHSLDKRCTSCNQCQLCSLDTQGRTVRMKKLHDFFASQIDVVEEMGGSRRFRFRYVHNYRQLKRLRLNKSYAVARFKSLEKSFKKAHHDQQLQFVAKLQEGEDKGFWHEVDEGLIPTEAGAAHYLPASLALKDEHTTTKMSTKLRLVLDPASRSHAEVPSYNETLSSVINLQRPIQSILLEQRFYPLLSISDISKMFPSFALAEEDCWRNLFLARRDAQGKLSVGCETDKMVTLRNLRSITGVSQTPLLSHLAMEKVADSIREGDDKVPGDPVTAAMFIKLIYLDDSSLPCLYEELVHQFQSGGLRQVLNCLANRAVCLEYHLRKFSLSTKGHTIVANLGQPVNFSQLVNLKLNLIKENKNWENLPADVTLPENLDTPLLTLPLNLEKAAPWSAVKQSGLDSQEQRPADEQLGHREEDDCLLVNQVHGDQQDSILGFAINPSDDTVSLSKLPFVNLTRKKRGVKDPRFHLYTAEDFISFAATTPITVRMCLSLVHSLWDCLSLANPVRACAAVLFRKVVLDNGEEEMDPAFYAESTTQAVKKKVKKGAAKTHFQKVVAKKHLPAMAELVGSIIATKSMVLGRRYVGPPAWLQDASNSLLYLADACMGIFGLSAVNVYFHTEGVTPDGRSYSHAALLKSASHLNSPYKLTHQAAAELQSADLAATVKEEVQDVLPFRVDRHLLLMDSQCSIRQCISPCTIFHLKTSLIVNHVQQNFAPGDIFFLEGKHMKNYTDKCTRAFPQPHKLLDEEYFGKGELSKPLGLIDMQPSHTLASFDTRSLPDVDKELVDVMQGVGSPSLLQLSVAVPILPRGPTAACEESCLLCCTARPTNQVDKSALDNYRVPPAHKDYYWVGPPPSAELQLQSHLSSQASPFLRNQADPLLHSSLSICNKIEVQTNLAVTTLFGIKSARSNTRQRPPPRPRLAQHHVDDKNPLAHVFQHFEDGFFAIKNLAKALRWIHLFRKHPVPPFYQRIRQTIMACLKSELKAALVCRQRHARGAQSDLLYEIAQGILFARGRREAFPVKLETDTQAMVDLHPAATQGALYAVPFLCGATAFAKALLRHFHLKACGSSPQNIKALTERQFQICHSLPYLQQLRKTCPRCRMIAQSPLNTELGPLPFDYSAMKRAQYMSLDIAGPWFLNEVAQKPGGRESPVATRLHPAPRRFKIWLLLAVDTFDRRAHYQILTDMGMTTFFSAYRALCAKIGGPTRNVQVDAASILQPAKRLLLEDKGQQSVGEEQMAPGAVTRQEVHQLLINLQSTGEKVVFMETCPKRPWAQGRVERFIQTLKRSLYMAHHNKPKFSLASFIHTLDVIFGQVNSRPLAFVPGQNPSLLTPNQLSGVCGEMTVFDQIPIFPTTKVYALQKIFEDNFRQQFLLHVLPQYKKLFGRFGQQLKAQAGAIVLMLDRNSPRGVPQLARVEAIDEGQRKCLVRYAINGVTATAQRPFNGLCLVTNPDEEKPVHFDPFEPAAAADFEDQDRHVILTDRLDQEGAAPEQSEIEHGDNQAGEVPARSPSPAPHPRPPSPPPQLVSDGDARNLPNPTSPPVRPQSLAERARAHRQAPAAPPGQNSLNILKNK